MRVLQLLTGYSVLIAFLWGAGGTSCMEAVHNWHRSGVQARIASKSADTILISYERYSEVTKANVHEIELNGRMYDIANAQIDGNEVLLSGQFDSFDDSLFAMLDKWLAEEEGDNEVSIEANMFLFYATMPVPLMIQGVWSTISVSGYCTRDKAPLLLRSGDVLKAPPDGRTVLTA
jgi:hypothetical protein